MAEFSIFSVDPATLAGYGNGATELEILSVGTMFYTNTDAWITHLRYPQPATGSDPAQKQMAIYEDSGVRVVEPILMPVPTPGQWCTAPLPAPFKLTPGVRYKAVTFYPHGGYPATTQYFNDGTFGGRQQYGPIIVPSSGEVAFNAQGSFKYDTAMAYPTDTFNNAAYYADIIATDTDPTIVVEPPADLIYGSDGTAYTAHALIDGTLVPVTLTL